MRSTLTYLGLAVAALVAAQLLPPGPVHPAPAAGQLAPSAEEGRRPAGFTPRSRLLTNDPRHRPHAISDALVRDIDAVPRGASIDVSTYWISSRRIAGALRRALRRGVHVHVILAGNDKAHRFLISRRLIRKLNAPGTPGSWGIWSDGAARGSGGIMHQKSYRFSRVGDARWVVVNGSYNSADTSDTGTYAMAWQVVGDRALYDAFAAIERGQAAQRTLARPLRSFRGSGWSAYFLPAAPNPATDPVMRRLRGIPGRHGTVIRIEMYSMWGPRGEWVARRLAAMARGGARITLVAGPTVSEPVRSIMRAGGVVIRPGCFADHTFTHAKDMTATWLNGRTRHYRTWVGSDNWTSDGMASDEAVVGVDGQAGYRAFTAAFRHVTSRRDGVTGAACRPQED